MGYVNVATLSPAAKPNDPISNMFDPNVKVFTLRVWAFFKSDSRTVWNEYLGIMASDSGGIAVLYVAGSVAIVAENVVVLVDYTARFTGTDNFWVADEVVEAIWGLIF